MFQVFYLLSLIVLLLTGVQAHRTVKNRLPWLIGGTALALFLILLPMNMGGTVLENINSAAGTIVQTLWVMGLGEEYTADFSLLPGCSDGFSLLYLLTLVLLYILAPVFTASFALSFFHGVRAWFLWRFMKKTSVVVFSHPDCRSLSLARDLQKEGTCLVFCDAADTDCYSELKELGAVLHKQKIGEVPGELFLGKVPTSVYFMTEDEERNLREALDFLQNRKRQARASLYVITSLPEAEPILNASESKNLPCRRVDEACALVYEDLMNTGLTKISHREGGRDILRVLVAGGGRYAFQMLRSLLWFWCGEDRRLELTVLAEPETEERFRLHCPGVTGVQEEMLSIRFIPCRDLSLWNPDRAPDEPARSDFIFIDRENDLKNLELALRLRSSFLRKGQKPVIQAVMTQWNTMSVPTEGTGGQESGSAVLTLKDMKGNDYGIQFIDNAARFTEHGLLQPELEEKAREMHRFYNRKAKPEEVVEQFYRYDYNCRSSRAQALYWMCRKKDGEVIEDNLTNHKREHLRWCMYMLSEGYQAPGEHPPEIDGQYYRMAKLHTDLVPWDELSEATKNKDHTPLQILCTHPPQQS